MASLPAMLEPALHRATRAFAPVQSRWNALETGVRRLIAIGAVLLAAGFLVAFVWLPAVRSRDALTVRLPQLEMRLAQMQHQAKELNALANRPAVPAPVPTPIGSPADVAVLQSIFGTNAQVTAVAEGFRIVIPAIEYAAWWDKTGDAIARHALALHALTLTRVDAQKPGGSVVDIDMRLARPVSKGK
jgi:hypothetical protein